MRDVTVLCSDVINSLGLVRALGEAGYRVECFCYGISPGYIIGSKYVGKGLSFKSCEEAITYLVNDYPIKDEKPVLFTIPDPPQYYADLHLNELSQKFVIFNAGEPGRVVYWMDKFNISSLARKYGFNVPWMIKLNKNDAVPKDIRFPVFVKSSNSTQGGKVDEGICYNDEELINKIHNLTSDNFIIMEYVKKVKEMNYFGIAIKGHVYIDYNDERERFRKDGYGYYNSFHLCDYDEFHQRMVDMMKETQYQGLFDVEFLVGEDGEKYFTEVNFRVDGEVYKLVPGINFADYWCKLVDLPQKKLPERLRTGKDSFYGITEVGDFRTSVLTGKINWAVWLCQFFRADKRMLFNIKDPLPFFIKIKDAIKHRYALRRDV